MALSTFTPVVAGSSSAGAPTYIEQYGGFETNGDLTTCTFRVAFDAASFIASGASGSIGISGFPVDQAAGNNANGYLSFVDGCNAIPTGAVVGAGVSGAHLTVNVPGSAHRALQVSDLVATGTVRFAGQITINT